MSVERSHQGTKASQVKPQNGEVHRMISVSNGDSFCVGSQFHRYRHQFPIKRLNTRRAGIENAQVRVRSKIDKTTSSKIDKTTSNFI